MSVKLPFIGACQRAQNTYKFKKEAVVHVFDSIQTKAGRSCCLRIASDVRYVTDNLALLTSSTQVDQASRSFRTAGCLWSIFRQINCGDSCKEVDNATYIRSEEVVIIPKLAIYMSRPPFVFRADNAVYALGTCAMIPIYS